MTLSGSWETLSGSGLQAHLPLSWSLCWLVPLLRLWFWYMRYEQESWMLCCTGPHYRYGRERAVCSAGRYYALSDIASMYSFYSYFRRLWSPSSFKLFSSKWLKSFSYNRTPDSEFAQDSATYSTITPISSPLRALRVALRHIYFEWSRW